MDFIYTVRAQQTHDNLFSMSCKPANITDVNCNQMVGAIPSFAVGLCLVEAQAYFQKLYLLTGIQKHYAHLFMILGTRLRCSEQIMTNKRKR